MREIVFKMERPGLVEEGQTVEVSESVSPVNVNYMIEPPGRGKKDRGKRPRLLCDCGI